MAIVWINKLWIKPEWVNNELCWLDVSRISLFLTASRLSDPRTSFYVCPSGPVDAENVQNQIKHWFSWIVSILNLLSVTKLTFEPRAWVARFSCQYLTLSPQCSASRVGIPSLQRWAGLFPALLVLWITHYHVRNNFSARKITAANICRDFDPGKSLDGGKQAVETASPDNQSECFSVQARTMPFTSRRMTCTFHIFRFLRRTLRVISLRETG